MIVREADIVLRPAGPNVSLHSAQMLLSIYMVEFDALSGIEASQLTVVHLRLGAKV